MKILINDFVLISPETITNTDLSKIITKHIEVKSNSQTHIMTMNFKHLPNKHNLRTVEDENLVIFNKDTKDLYRY